VRRLPTDVGVTAVGLAGDVVAVGYREGSVELRRDRDGAPSAIPLHDVPASPAVRLIPGPDGTLVAGFADGTFGLWSAEDGGRLLHAKLHGAARHLLLEGSSLYAATELGDHARLDLDVLAEDYCTLLRALWEEVPVVWVGGRAVPARPDPTHLCAE